MLWVKGNLTNLEKICINSFLHHGYKLILWTYGEIHNSPKGIQIKDAKFILPKKKIFLINNSYAPFSNLFRYHLLKKLGGLWVDTDIVCLKKFDHLCSESFLVSEKTRPRGFFRRLFRVVPLLQINNNVIYNKNIKDKNIIDLALVISLNFPYEKFRWGGTGPHLLTALDKFYRQLSFKIMPPDFANSIPAKDCPGKLLQPNVKISKDATFLHLYNEMWRRSGISKDGPFPENSILARLEKKFLSS